MQRTPAVGSTVYAWENNVSVFDLAEWQEKVFQPISTALYDSDNVYAKRPVEGKKTCVIEAPDGSTWWLTKPSGKSGVRLRPAHFVAPAR